MQELTAACERQCTAIVTTNNGSWLRVSLTQGLDDLPQYIALEKVLGYFPENDRLMMPVPLGVTEGNYVEYLRFGLPDQAHLLIAGTTGGSKSNFLNNILCATLRKYSPSEAQLCA